MTQSTDRPAPHKRADLSRDRRRLAFRMLRGEGILEHPDLDDDAKLLYTVGLLVCDNQGRMSQADLDAALDDPSIVNAARQIMARAAR